MAHAETRLDNFAVSTRPAATSVSALAHIMFEAQAHAHPEHPAIHSSSGSLTYGQLNERANRLAHYFQSLGAGRETIVALWLRRTPWFIVTALAAMKAGAAYLPLDPTNPRERLQYMVRDSGAKLVVTDTALQQHASGVDCPLLVVEQLCDLANDATDPLPATGPEDLSYLIYTSGSTGTPKGVEITHSNLSNLIRWHNDAFEVTQSDRASQLAGLGFDASVWEIWPYLAAGASLQLADVDTLTSADTLQNWLVSNEITIGFVPTPLAEMLVARAWPNSTKLRVLLTGGDALHVRPKPNLPFSFVNNYGPTECTVVSTSGVVSPWSNEALPSIGYPIQGSEVLILDPQLDEVPVGQIGELYVGGANVGRGYHGRPDLTSERFISHPRKPGTRLYKTGDLGRMLSDGSISFLGRSDSQTKIRGYRIELDEISAVLNSHPAVNASTVVARSDEADEKRLIAYVVFNEAATKSDLQDFLLKQLPEYMVPATFVVLDSRPLTSNGKIDCASLPSPQPDNVLADPITPAISPVEQNLSAIISDLLKVKEVGLDDDFFLLGGHSLLGTQLIARIRDSFGVEIPLRSLFEQPTVRGLAGEVERLLVDKINNMTEDDAQRELGRMNDSLTSNRPAA